MKDRNTLNRLYREAKKMELYELQEYYVNAWGKTLQAAHCNSKRCKKLEIENARINYVCLKFADFMEQKGVKPGTLEWMRKKTQLNEFIASKFDMNVGIIWGDLKDWKVLLNILTTPYLLKAQVKSAIFRIKIFIGV